MHYRHRELMAAALVLVGTLALVGGAAGQAIVEVTPAPCSIDVRDAMVALGEAQAAAEDGDTTLALDAIDDAQAMLEEVVAVCALSSLGGGLGETFAAADVPFTFSYPSGWVVGEPVDNLALPGAPPPQIVASKRAALDVFTTGESPQSGAYAVLVVVGTSDAVLYAINSGASELTSGDYTLETLASAIVDSSNGVVRQAVPMVLDDTRVVEMFSEGAGLPLELTLILVGLDDDRFALLAGANAPGERESLLTTLRAMALSAQPGGEE